MNKIRNIISIINEYQSKSAEEMFLECVKQKLNNSLIAYYNDITTKLKKAYEKVDESIELEDINRLNKGLGGKR